MELSLEDELQEFCRTWEEAANVFSRRGLTPKDAQIKRDDFEFAKMCFELTKAPTVYDRNVVRDRLGALKLKVETAITEGEAMYQEQERPNQGKRYDMYTEGLRAISSLFRR